MREIQRTRLIAAMAQAACEIGAAEVTVADVTARAAVSRRTFYECFAGCEECLLATLEVALQRASDRTISAYEQADGSWSAHMRAALVALLSLFDEQRQIGRLLVVEWLRAGPRALRRRANVIAQLVEVVDRGRAGRRRGPEPLPIAAEAVVGAAMSILHERMLQGSQAGRLMELANPLMSVIVLPYLGSAASQRELRRPIADHDVRRPLAKVPAGPPATGMPVRVTHRTTLVLNAIAIAPGACNREIGVAAGITDQGQISKLLVRLRERGLIENGSSGPGQRGRPNSWSLTDVGERMLRSLRL